MNSPQNAADCNLEFDPGLCARCRVPGSPKGSRITTLTRIDAEGRCFDEAVRRVRLQCLVPDCPMGSWTIYEEGGYPYRRFDLAVLISAGAELAVEPEATFTSVAARLGCHRTTVARAVAWIAGIHEVDELVQTCARMDPDGLPPPPPLALPSSPRIPPRTAAIRRAAGHVLRLLDRLGDLFRRWRVPLEVDSGLIAILRRQFLATGEVLWLIRPSPPMLVDWKCPGP